MTSQPAPESDKPFWPCPHNCINWCREWSFNQPDTRHHQRCEYVDTSLMDVWRVQTPGDPGGCIVSSERQAREMATEDHGASLEVTPQKMHREIYERLEEFAGF